VMASVRADLPMPGPAIRNTARLVRLRMTLQIRSSGSRRPVKSRDDAPDLVAWPLDESSQISPGSNSEFGEDLVQVAFNGTDRDTHLQCNVPV
jgi:hypothetical protein